MPTLIIDGESYDVDGSKNLLEVCIQLGLEIPYFCWHPAIGSVGSCRQCAVKQFQDENDQRGRMVMSCMTAISDGMIISLKDPATQEFRDLCIESTMSNHPHDCPVCEKGGECHLQDMTNLSDHTVRFYDGKKRTFQNQTLGPFINHEMNRCITCFRCVRYYQDYAGGDDLQAQGSASHVYFGRDQSGTLESPFSGNLVEVCPTGVFTDKTYSQHYARKWDLQTAPSICSHCAVGCNTSPGERYGTLRRVVNRYNGAVNGYFLCDRGRFAYDFVNSEQRVREIFRKRGDRFEAISEDDGLRLLSHWSGVGKGKGNAKGKGTAIGIGSPRASLEANYALQDLVGVENFYAGVSHHEQQVNQTILNVLSAPPADIASMAQVKQADAIIILGEDILNTAPLLALSVRQATKNKGKAMAAAARIPEWLAAAVQNIAQEVRSPLINLTVAATDLDDISERCYRDIPDQLALVGRAIAHGLDASAPKASDLTETQRLLVNHVVSLLKAARRPLIIAGSGCHSSALVEAAANIAQALTNRGNTQDSEPRPQAMISLVVQEANSLGLTALLKQNPTADLDAAIKRCVESQTSELTALVLENDLSRRVEPCIQDSFDQSVDHLIVLDCIESTTSAAAELILPSASVAESEGTFVSSEGRAQRHFAVFPPAQQSLPSWQWMMKANSEARWQYFDEITAACADAYPLLKGIVDAAPDASFRLNGSKVARQPHRYSGRGSMHSNISVDETRRPMDDQSALSFSMEGLSKDIPNALQPDRWAPAWNSSESVHQMQSEVGGALKGGDPGVRLFDGGKSTGEWWGAESDAMSVETSDAMSAIPLNDSNQNLIPVALYHIFGSDELSVYSPALAERIPAPYVALNSLDAKALQVSAGDAVSVQLGDTVHVLSVRLNDSLVPGCVGIPQLKEFQFGALHKMAHLEKTTAPALASLFPLPTKKILIKELSS